MVNVTWVSLSFEKKVEIKKVIKELKLEKFGPNFSLFRTKIFKNVKQKGPLHNVQ